MRQPVTDFSDLTGAKYVKVILVMQEALVNAHQITVC